MKNEKVWKLSMTGVFAALSYVVFTFCRLSSGSREGMLPRSILEMLSAFWAR